MFVCESIVSPNKQIDANLNNCSSNIITQHADKHDAGSIVLKYFFDLASLSLRFPLVLLHFPHFSLVFHWFSLVFPCSAIGFHAFFSLCLCFPSSFCWLPLFFHWFCFVFHACSLVFLYFPEFSVFLIQFSFMISWFLCFPPGSWFYCIFFIVLLLLPWMYILHLFPLIIGCLTYMFLNFCFPSIGLCSLSSPFPVATYTVAVCCCCWWWLLLLLLSLSFL